MINPLRIIRRSLPARLIVLFIFMGIGALIIVSTLFTLGLRDQWRTMIRPHLVQYLHYVREDIGVPPNLDNARELAARLPINIYIRGPDVNFSSTDRQLDLTDIRFRDRGDEPRWRRRYGGGQERVAVGERDDSTILRIDSGDYRLYFEVDRRHDHGHREGVFIIGLAALIGLILIAYYLIRRMLRPVQDIQAGVQLMGGGQLSHRIEVRRDDDLGELTGSINTMAGEIQDMLDAKRQLLLAISHELRSPLTRARVSVELLEPSSLRERLDDDLREMQALISDLLESERLNNRHAVLQKNATDIVALAKDVIEKNFSGQVTLNSTAWVGDVDVDAARVQLLLRNLIGNAVRHGGAASRQPVVDIDRDGENLRLTVTDFGPGIPAEDLKNITEPFYRVDTDRSRETGGFGLGLYLCRLIAQAHAGDLAIDSEPDRRTSVTARLRVTNEETSHA